MRQARGFTLIEILVALTVFALVGGTLLQLFHSGLKTARIATEHTHAALLARSKLAELQAFDRLQPGTDEGEFADGFRWQVVLSELPELQQPGVTPLTPLALSLRVLWGTDDDERSVTVDSLLLSRESE
jgi:general secretion pathway protein I